MTDKNNCPKTMSGKHYWEKKPIGIDLDKNTMKVAIECSKCGMLDDREEKK